ncbi:MAG TPA: LysM domain-containing protein [Mycobacteriales bacterium]|nr:LysM domain-containing protein [Mycobacteriales bacterium]
MAKSFGKLCIGMLSTLVAMTAFAPGAATAATAAVVASAPAPRVVVSPHNGRHIVMHRDSRLQVMLTTCATCGFFWDVTRRPNTAVARFIGLASTGTPACLPSPCVGGNSNEFVSFAATGYGQTTVHLGYRSPSGTIVRTLTLELVVVRHGRSAAAHLHLVRSGDTLYRIARAQLGSRLTNARLTALVHRIYADNHETIGSNPGLLLPGEMLLVDPTGI